MTVMNCVGYTETILLLQHLRYLIKLVQDYVRTPFTGKTPSMCIIKFESLRHSPIVRLAALQSSCMPLLI